MDETPDEYFQLWVRKARPGEDGLPVVTPDGGKLIATAGSALPGVYPESVAAAMVAPYYTPPSQHVAARPSSPGDEPTVTADRLAPPGRGHPSRLTQLRQDEKLREKIDEIYRDYRAGRLNRDGVAWRLRDKAGVRVHDLKIAASWMRDYGKWLEENRG
jgi:hypothetical protein